MKPEKFEITKKKLEEFEKQTKDEFLLLLISDLKKDLKEDPENIFNFFAFSRIKELVSCELNRKKIKEFNTRSYKAIAYKLQIAKRNGKQVDHILNGEFSLNLFSGMIKDWFGLEPMHLYEFKIGEYRYGPECDEWQEMFDSLDNFKLGAAISAAKLTQGDVFDFLYDFGDNIKFKIKILNIEKLNTEV